MKKFWVCCFAAACVVLSGCAKGQPEQTGQTDQADVPQETASGERQDLPQPEAPAGPEAPPEAEASGDPFIGTWQDPDTPQCRMEVTGGCGDGYAIEIVWSREPGESEVWQLTGTYDDIWEGVAYVGAKYTEDASAARTPVPDREEITGFLSFADDGALSWIDDFDHAGDGLAFAAE